MDLSHTVWRKASQSKEDGSNCVELTSTLNAVAVRDSKNPNGPMMVLSRRDFQRFAEFLKNL